MYHAKLCNVQGKNIYEKFDIRKCAEWIIFNQFRKVSLQFPDELLNDAVEVVNALKDCVGEVELFILGDTSFRSCCIDRIAAKHVNAEAIIHFGRACLSSFEQSISLYIFPKEFLNILSLVESITNFVKQRNCYIVLLYDIVFAHYADELSSKFSPLIANINVSRLLTNQRNSNDLNSSNTDIRGRDVKKLGRTYCLPFEGNHKEEVYVYVKWPANTKNMENFLLSSEDRMFFSYDSTTDVLCQECIPKTIKKKLYDIEKVKEARRIGILVATLEIDSFLDALQRIKKLCTLKNKKSYIISVGKPTVAKLANFPEIDLFVMISCPEAEIVDKKNYFQPIVSMMELELALNDKQSWKGKYVADFRDFLNDGSEYKQIDDPSSKTYVEVSLLSNRLIGFNADFNTAIHFNEDVATDTSELSLKSFDLNLKNRSWKGLQLQNVQMPPSEVTTGKKGTPAGGYRNQVSDNLT